MFAYRVSLVSLMGLLAMSARAEEAWVRYTLPVSDACRSHVSSSEITGDFDGDGKPDTAYLEKNRSSGKVRIVGRLGNGSLVTVKEWQIGTAMFFGKVPPGDLKTWCGKSGECGAGEHAAVKLKNDAIVFGECGGTSSVYYWSAAEAKFSAAVISD